MLTGVKVSSLAYKCLFYKPEQNTKGEHHGNESSWNVKMK